MDTTSTPPGYATINPFFVVSDADGLLARCLQHEIDHLDGVLFIDRLSALKRSMVLEKYRALLAEEEAAANTASEKLTAPVALLSIAFLLLFLYPALARLMGS